MSQATPWNHCSVELRDGGRCGREAHRGAPFPICAQHLREAFSYCQKMLAPAEQDLGAADVFARREALDRFYQQKMKQPKPSVVYYIQVGDRIKIGTTINLASRKAAYPPGSKLLATEPGGYALEASRHSDFAADLVAGREWFAPSPQLLEHIASLAH